jgi:hypothetical protein
MAETVRIDPAAHAALAEVARAKDIPLTEALSRAVELYRRHIFLEAMTAGFAQIQSDPAAAAEEAAELALWDKTLADGERE